MWPHLLAFVLRFTKPSLLTPGSGYHTFRPSLSLRAVGGESRFVRWPGVVGGEGATDRLTSSEVDLINVDVALNFPGDADVSFIMIRTS